MSLKAFHVLFITAATLLCGGFGWWAIRQYQAGDGSVGELALGLASIVFGLGLLIYGIYFLKKMKHISYL